MPVIYISDSNDPRLDDYLRLSDRQLLSKVDPQRSRMICESRLVIEVALDQGLRPLSLFVDQRHEEALSPLFSRLDPDVPVCLAPTELMSDIRGYNITRGILGCFPRPAQRDPRELLRDARRVAVLEDIVDVTNVGAILRSAAALGVDAVLLAPTCADPLRRRALRVSMGTALVVPWARLPKPWPASGLDLLHEQGFCCAALALEEDAWALDDPRLVAQERLALFFGTEGDGLSSRALAGCDRTVVIPMSRGVDSLNVAAASAVAFWELCRRQTLNR